MAHVNGAAAPTSSSPGTAAGHALFVAWIALAILVAATCALGARAALRAADLGRHALRAGVAGATVIVPLMAALTLAVGVYSLALNVDSAPLAAAANGPIAALSTTVVLTCQLAVMAAGSILAARTARRGRGALRGV